MCTAMSIPSGNRSQLIRQTFRRPHHRRRCGDPLQKIRPGMFKVHPSIHPNRLYPFCGSRLLRRYLQPQRITAHRYSYQLRNNHACSPHRSRLHRQISCQPSGKEQISTPLRGRDPEAALRFGRGKPCRPAPERCSQHLLYQEPRRRGHKKWPRRTPNGRCLKRAVPVRPELLPQRRKGWSKLR